MDQPEVISALAWISWFELLKRIGGFMVIAGVAIEVGGDWVSAPFHKIVDDARELQIVQLTRDAARLTTEGDVARKETAEAKLQLEQLRKQMGPRQIQSAAFLKSLEGQPKGPVETMFPKENGEAFLLAIQLRDLLRAAKWQATEPIAVPQMDVPRLANQPSHIAAGGQAVGVAIAVRANTQEEFKLVDDLQANTPMNALQAALSQALGTVSGYAAGPDSFSAPAPGVIRIIVGPKP